MTEGLAYRVDIAEREIAGIKKTMYEGNGKPALTVRMALVEDTLEKLAKNMSRGIWLLVAILLTAIADFFVKIH